MAGFEDDIAKEIADILRQYVAAATKPLKDRIAELERCVKEIELRGELKYLGTWREDQQYERGNFCTMNGGMWHCEMRTQSRPGTDATVKSGGR
jgi:hypothetical protein